MCTDFFELDYVQWFSEYIGYLYISPIMFDFHETSEHRFFDEVVVHVYVFLC